MNTLVIAGITIEQTGPAEATITLADGSSYTASNIVVLGDTLTCELAPIFWWAPKATIQFAPTHLTVTIADAPEDNGSQVYPVTPEEDAARIKFLADAAFPVN